MPKQSAKVPVTLPPFHEIPKEDLRAAYLWELDRELWDAKEMWEANYRPGLNTWLTWPELSEHDKAHARKCIGKPVVESEVIPDPARAASMWFVEAFLERVDDIYPKPHYKPSFYASAPHPLDRIQDDGSVELPNNCLDDNACFQESEALRFLPLIICASATKKEILASISKELDRLIPSHLKNKRRRGISYVARFYSLLASRLKREGCTIEEAKLLIKPCKKQWECGELTEKRWSDFALEARRDMNTRWKKLWELCCKADEEDAERKGHEVKWHRNQGRGFFIWPNFLCIGYRDKTPADEMGGMGGLLVKNAKLQ